METPVVRLLLSLAVLLAAAIVGGRIARRWRLPAVVGELVAGVLLGPTVLARVAPGVSDFLFPAAGPVADQRQVLVTAGLLGFLLVAGLEMDVSRLAGRLAAVLCVGACGIAVPFALGVAVVHLAPSLFGPSLDPGLLAIFIGTALSISALPVIARTLMDLGIHRTPLATLVLAAAIVDDVVGWSLFAFVSRRARGLDTRQVWLSLASVSALIATAIVGGRMLVARLRPWIEARLPEIAPRVALVAAATFAAAALAEIAGVHAVFGGFLTGVVLSQGARRDEVNEICHAFGTGVLAPLYFATIGLRADFFARFDPWLTLVVLAVACAGKIGAATVAGGLTGMPRRESLALGVALNARGAMEILLAGVALDQKLIDERLFVSLVVMAIVTSLMSGPLLSALVPGLRPEAEGADVCAA